MFQDNPVIRISNYFLLGISAGGLAAWFLSSLNDEVTPSQPLAVLEKKIADEPAKIQASRQFFNGTTGDSDSDGIPDSWELAHSLDPHDSDDASSDFDRDGLTALQEFQHGTDPLGVWTEELVDLGGLLRSQNLDFKKLTASGYLLVSGRPAQSSLGSKRAAVLWHRDTGAVMIPKEVETTLYVHDVNDSGEVVGGYLPPGGGDQTAFVWSASEEAISDIAAPSGMEGFTLGYRINDWGQILLQAAATGSIVSAVVSPSGETISELEGGEHNPRLLCLNNFGEMLGVALSPIDGWPKAFLRLPGLPDFDTTLASSYPALFNDEISASPFSAQMNDFGEFACDFNVGGSNWNPEMDTYFFDGDYHSYREPNDHRLQILGLSNSPQLLFSVQSYRPGFSYSYDRGNRFSSGGQTVPLSAFHDTASATYSTIYHLLNEEGEILGFHRSGFHGRDREPFILRLNQDADADGLADDWEGYYGLDPHSAADANQDADGDGFTNLAEFKLRRNPNLAEVPSAQTGHIPDLRPGIDTDGDGMPNVWEVHHGLNWEDPSDAPLDPDRDGFSNLEEFQLGTDPVGAPSYRVLDLPPSLGAQSRLFNITGQRDRGFFGTSASSQIDQSIFHWQPEQLTPTSPSAEALMVRPLRQAVEFPYLRDGTSEVLVGQGRPLTNPSVTLPTYFDSSGTRTFSSPNLTSGWFTSISSDSRYLLGVRRFASTSEFFVHDRELDQTSVLPLGNLTAAPWGKFAIHPWGYAMAPARDSASRTGVAVWKRNTSGSWHLQTFIPDAQVANTYMSRSGLPLIAGTLLQGGTRSIFTWEPGVGQINRGDVAHGIQAYVTAMSERGTFGGYTLISESNSGKILQKAFVSHRSPTDGSFSFHLLTTPVGEQSRVTAINDHGETLGTLRSPTFGQQVPVLWRGTATRFPLSEVVHQPGRELHLSSASTINNRGEISAYGYDDEGIWQRFILQSDSDTDDDGLPDQYENSKGFNPFDNSDGSSDLDGDGLSNAQEFRHQTDPVLADTDADGMPDGWEIGWGLDALNPENGSLDPDRDFVSNLREFEIGTVPTGIYELSQTELPAATWQSASLVARSPDQTSFLINLHASGVTQHPVIVTPTALATAPSTIKLPPLAVGKRATASAWSENGSILGYATTSTNRRRIVQWDSDDLTATPSRLLYGSGDGSQSIMAISENGNWILARWQKPDGSYTLGTIDNSYPSDGVIAMPNVDVINEALSDGETIQWTRITNNGDLLGIRKKQEPGSDLVELTLVKRPKPPISSVIPDLVSLHETPIRDRSGTWLAVRIVGEIDHQSYLVSLTGYGSFYDSGSSSKQHFLIRDLGTYGNVVPSPAAILLDLPEALSFRVLDTNASGDLLAHQSNLSGFLNRGQGMIRLDALRIHAEKPPIPTSLQSLPTLGGLLNTPSILPTLLDPDGSLAGLIINPDRSIRIWAVTEKTDEDGNGLNDDWQAAYEDWTGSDRALNGLSIDPESGLMLAQLSTTGHAAGGIIITTDDWVGEPSQPTVAEIERALSPRLIVQTSRVWLSSWEDDDSLFGSWGIFFTTAPDYPLVFWENLSENTSINELNRSSELYPMAYGADQDLDPDQSASHLIRSGKLPSIYQLVRSDIRTFRVGADPPLTLTRLIQLEKTALQIQLSSAALRKQTYLYLIVANKVADDADGDPTKELLASETRAIELTVEKDATQSDVVEIIPDEQHLVEVENQPYSLLYDLLPIDIRVTKGNEAKAPEDGLVVKNSDWVRYRLFGKGVPDEPLLLEDKIQWHWRILKWDGTYEVWKPFQDGKGHTFTANPKDSGIYEVKATVDGQDFFFVRKKDDPHSAKKKDENDCFGVVDKQWQIDVRDEAKKNLGWDNYAFAIAHDPFKANSWKCNLFVGKKATEGGAIVPKINGRNPFNKHYPIANQWAGVEVKNIPNWTLLARETYPQPGWVIARGVGGGTGHTGIIGYDGAWISAGATEVNRKADLRNAKYQEARFHKYTQ